MKTWFYSWIIYPLLFTIGFFYGLFNRKVRKTLELRSWKDYLSLRYNVGRDIEIWVHVASQGELEYAIPILKEYEKNNKQILITYYSISAKEWVEKLPSSIKNVSLVVPLPHDGLGLMKSFVKLAKKQGIKKLLLLKYELWPGLLWECNRNGIKVYLVNSLKPSWFHQKLIHKLAGIYSGYESEIAGVPHPNCRVVGDTRVARVLERVEKKSELVGAELSKFFKSGPTLVCGSMWPKDTELLMAAIEQGKDQNEPMPNLIWVPHEIDLSEQSAMKQKFEKLGYAVANFDECTHPTFKVPQKPLCMLVFKKGVLVELYQYGQVSFVGGGFGSGVHSVWEPALMKSRVLCGPRIDRSPEAKMLSEHGLLRTVSNSEQMSAALKESFNLKKDDMELKLSEIVASHLRAPENVVKFCL